MNTKSVSIDSRFSDGELFGLFNVECANSWTSPNCLSVPLLKVRSRKVKPSSRVRHTCDHIKPDITDENPGKSRVNDLVKFYNNPLNAGVSPFEV